ncbi:hypothetical protein R6Q59_003181 [Mikania micrantha]
MKTLSIENHWEVKLQKWEYTKLKMLSFGRDMLNWKEIGIAMIILIHYHFTIRLIYNQCRVLRDGREGLNWDGTDQNVVSTWGDGWDWIGTYFNINYFILSIESRSEVGYYLIIELSIGGLGMQVAGWCYCAGQIWVDFIWAGNLEAALYRWTSGFKGWGNFSGQGCEGITDGKDKCLKNVDFQNGQPITIKG